MSKYLVVEDLPSKYKEIRSELLNNRISDSDIVHVTSVNEATNLMKTTQFSLVILDLNLPLTNGGIPNDKGGIILLSKLKHNHKKYILPNQIIGLTSYEHLKKIQNSEFETLCFSIYDFQKIDWKIALNNKLKWDLSTSKIKNRESGNTIIYTVHGIRTLGYWQNKLKEVFSKNGFKTENFKFNYFSAYELLIPSYRRKVIDKLSHDLADLSNENPNARIIIFTHSFGTYALIKALESLPLSCDLTIEKLFLISSVLKSSYDFDEVCERFNIGNIINECGFNDKILLLSHYFCSDMGMAGRSGFIGSKITNRFFEGGHDFFNRQNDFIEKYWLSEINNENITNYDERKFSSIRENLEIILYTKHLPIMFAVSLLILMWL